MGFLSAPMALSGLVLGPWAGLIKIGLAVAAFWGAYAWVHHRGYERGYAARDALYVAELKRANKRVDMLNAELEAAQRAMETRHREAASAAVIGIVSQPQCVKSACALSDAAKATLNRIE